MKKKIHTLKAPQAIGPYSQAILSGDMLFISGQIPADPETRDIIHEIDAATHRVMKNLEAILNEAGGSFANVVKTSIFLKNMDDFGEVNEIYASYFTDGIYPARETVQVAKLPADVKIEISMIARI